MNNRAIIAMSGGVDSSVAAYIMKERKFDTQSVVLTAVGSTISVLT